MKISVILPVCDVPIGSGRPHYFLRECIESVRQGGHEDFELLVGCDGHVPAIDELVDSFDDERLIYVPFELTRAWGNYQCHRLLKDWARGDVVMWMNHDDRFTPGALKIAAEEVAAFPERPIFFRAIISCGVCVWTEEVRPSENSSHVQVHVLATVTPNRPWTPPYPDERSRMGKADLKWVQSVYDVFSERGTPPVWSKDVLVEVRPWAIREPLDFASSLQHQGQILESS